MVEIAASVQLCFRDSLGLPAVAREPESDSWPLDVVRNISAKFQRANCHARDLSIRLWRSLQVVFALSLAWVDLLLAGISLLVALAGHLVGLVSAWLREIDALGCTAGGRCTQPGGVLRRKILPAG